MATNPQCEQGEVLVQPAIGTGVATNSILDPETTLICRSTPIGASFITAEDGTALNDLLKQLGDEVCCDCKPN